MGKREYFIAYTARSEEDKLIYSNTQVVANKIKSISDIDKIADLIKEKNHFKECVVTNFIKF